MPEFIKNKIIDKSIELPKDKTLNNFNFDDKKSFENEIKRKRKNLSEQIKRKETIIKQET